MIDVGHFIGGKRVPGKSGRTADIMQPNMRRVGTTEMGQAIVKEMERLVA